MMMVLLLSLIIFTLLYYLTVKPYNFWSKRNVKTGQVIPLFGDNLYVVLGKESIGELVLRMYNKLTDVRFIGAYQFQEPVLVLKSPDIIKQICVKDFDHFLNHKGFVPDEADELWTKNLFSLKGHNWKNVRATLSPFFTSSKMKAMFALICQNANAVVEYFMEKNEKLIEVEFKDTLTRFTNDVIASTAFGIQVDSLRERENEFYIMGKEATNFTSTSRRMVFFLYQLFPKIAGFFRIPIFGEKLKSFFINIVKQTIKIREEQNVERPDVLGLLIKSRKGQLKEKLESNPEETSFAIVEEYLEAQGSTENFSDIDIVSHAFSFFLAGFETVASSMCFMAYELAVNPEVQKKLIEEIDKNRSSSGSSTYETLVNMKYMDMVVSETLRKWSSAVMSDRVVTKPYTVEPILPEEKSVHLDVNTQILIPIFGFHRDPRYYENPDKFDPDRFSPENRKNIQPYTYLPFGVGPRNCMGSRFALLEIKAIFFHLLSHFEIVPIEKTEIPLKISKKSLNLTSQNDFPLGLKRRL